MPPRADQRKVGPGGEKERTKRKGESKDERRFRSWGLTSPSNFKPFPPPASIALSLRTRLFNFNNANPSEVSCSSPPPPGERAFSFQREDRMRASERKNVKGEREKTAASEESVV